jgi:hypothetical protein
MVESNFPANVNKFQRSGQSLDQIFNYRVKWLRVCWGFTLPNSKTPIWIDYVKRLYTFQVRMDQQL